jgi:hypothetical protein
MSCAGRNWLSEAFVQPLEMRKLGSEVASMLGAGEKGKVSLLLIFLYEGSD